MQKIFRSLLPALLLILLQDSASKADLVSTSSPLKNDLNQLFLRLKKVQQQSFAELDQASLEISVFDDPDSFFQSRVDPLNQLSHQKNYYIDVNPRWFEHPAPFAALEAVLAHELAHSLDFQREGTAPILLQLLTNESQYEHRTDLQAIFRGYGPGLILYRRWLYQRLTPEQMILKRKNYYTPEEIQLIHKRFSQIDYKNRQILQQKWLKQPPLNQAEILQQKF